LLPESTGGVRPPWSSVRKRRILRKCRGHHQPWPPARSCCVDNEGFPPSPVLLEIRSQTQRLEFQIAGDREKRAEFPTWAGAVMCFAGTRSQSKRTEVARQRGETQSADQAAVSRYPEFFRIITCRGGAVALTGPDRGSGTVRELGTFLPAYHFGSCSITHLAVYALRCTRDPFGLQGKSKERNWR